MSMSVRGNVRVDYVNCKSISKLCQEKGKTVKVVNEGGVVYDAAYDHHPSLPCVGASDIVLGVGEGI